VRLQRQRLGLPQWDDRRAVLKSASRLVDADDAEDTARDAERVAHLQVHALRRSPAQDEGFAAHAARLRQRLSFDDAKVVYGKALGIVAKEE
jgi:hypothetical protein